jgi:S-adenosylmethionine:tRNA ribosyltransferase-isomerase
LPATPGAVAAPTAALHFDEGVLAALQARGVPARQRDATPGAARSR